MQPFDSLREYIAEMDARDNLLRIAEMDQDRYEMTAFGYRLDDRDKAKAPAFLVERTRINDRWYDTPVIANVLNNYWTVALSLGVDSVGESSSKMYDAAVTRIMSHLDDGYRWRSIDPVTVDGAGAPCKEVVLHGEQADLGEFPWIRNNPADGGQYISTGAVITNDPDLGRNVGTHRMMIKGPRKVGLDLSTQSHAYAHVQNAIKRGEKMVPVSVAIGIDPVSWMMSSTRLAGPGEDEFAIAGGFRGKPVRLVKSESNDLEVPAEAEMVLEGFIPVEREWEGPYGEMLGYIGERKNTYGIEVETITHRERPWVYNIWPGIGGAYLTLPWEVGPFAHLKSILPGLGQIAYAAGHTADRYRVYRQTDAGRRHRGRHGGSRLSHDWISQKDRDRRRQGCRSDRSDTGHACRRNAMAARSGQSDCQAVIPFSARSEYAPKLSEQQDRDRRDTRQLPAEGGPKVYALDNRTVMEEQAADAFDLVDSKWVDYFPPR